MISLLLSSGNNSVVWIAVIGFLFVLFVLPHIMGAAFDKADKEAQKGNGSCLGTIFIGVAILMMIVFIMQLKDCSNHGNYQREWEPRHTCIPQKPVQSFVNNIILHPLELPYIINKV